MVKIAQTHRPNVFRFRSRNQMRSFQMQQTGKMRANGKLTGGGKKKKKKRTGWHRVTRPRATEKEGNSWEKLHSTIAIIIIFSCLRIS